MVGSSCGQALLSDDESSHDHVGDQVWLTAPVEVPDVVVPLLSREGLTRRLLPGAAAPWSPALGPVLVPAVMTDCFDL